MNAPIEGGCLCGGLRFRLLQRPRGIEHCHCVDCRRAAGAPFVTWGTVARRDVEIVSGSMKLVAHAERVRWFAACCGTPVFFARTEHADFRDVAIATLDQPEAFPAEVEIWTEDRLPWILANHALRQFPQAIPREP